MPTRTERDTRSTDELAAAAEIKVRYEGAVVVDMLIPGSPQSYVDPTVAGFDEMAEMSIGEGFSYVSYTAAVDEQIDVTDVVASIARGRKHWLAHPEKYLLVDTVEDIGRARAESKLAVSFNFQGSNPLGRNLDMIEVYYRLGVRQVNFAYNARNFMADGTAVDANRDGGLSALGRRMVGEMNRVGMVIDCSHSSNRTCVEAAELSTRPIVLSHSNPYELYKIRRNASDDAIKALADTGGVIAINGIGGFLSEGARDISGDIIANNVEYVRQLVGIDHVAFGSDYVHDLEAAKALIASNQEAWPPEMGYGELDPQVAVPGVIWSVARALETQHGWSELDVRAFLGENAIRVYAANWQAS